METLLPYLKAVCGVVAMLALWLAVQRAWARAFPACGGGDVLALRPDCCDCAAAEDCRARLLIDGGPPVATTEKQPPTRQACDAIG